MGMKNYPKLQRYIGKWVNQEWANQYKQVCVCPTKEYDQTHKYENENAQIQSYGQVSICPTI